MTAPVHGSHSQYRSCPLGLRSRDTEDAHLQSQQGVVTDQGRQLDQAFLAEGGDRGGVLLVVQVGRDPRTG
jgi:hypothetical protein